MKLRNLIPVLLLILTIAPATQAEDIFDLKLGTSKKQIQRKYPDLKLADMKHPDIYSARAVDSVFHRIVFVFDNNEMLDQFVGRVILSKSDDFRVNCNTMETRLKRLFGDAYEILKNEPDWLEEAWLENDIRYELSCVGAIDEIRLRVTHKEDFK
jgi:hypothetical protein